MRAISAMTVLLGTVAACLSAPAPDVYRPVEKWQYGELSYVKQRSKSLVIRWQTSTSTVEADSWKELAKKLGAPEPKKAKEPEPKKEAGPTPLTVEETTKHKLLLFDHLGKQGWNLYSIDSTADNSPTGKGRATRSASKYLYSFKRRLVR